jgi:hypothetical protein
LATSSRGRLCGHWARCSFLQLFDVSGLVHHSGSTVDKSRLGNSQMTCGQEQSCGYSCVLSGKCQQSHRFPLRSLQNTHAVVRPSTMILICQSALSPRPGTASNPTCTGCVHECREMLKCLPPGILGTKQVRSGVGAAPAIEHQHHSIAVGINPRKSIRRRGRTIGARGPAAIASLHGVTSRLELLERHLAALGVEDDVPVLIAHGG